jgi:hypothetical protein
VLVAGGASKGNALASAELYDPVTNAFPPTGSLGGARSIHAAALIGNRKVLVIGGYNYRNFLSSAEVYTGPCVSAIDCASAALGECEAGLCDAASGVCSSVQKLDHSPCSGGICIAGGCYTESAPSSNSSSSSSAGASSAAGASAAGSGGATSSSGAAISIGGATSSAGAGNATGIGGGEADLHLIGGGCAIGRSVAVVAVTCPGSGSACFSSRLAAGPGATEPGEACRALDSPEPFAVLRPPDQNRLGYPPSQA